MDNTQLLVPNKIKVGYNSRSDTYTAKLAYIIYIDEKGKVRKEASWNSWRDHKLDDDSFENVPTEGFVINKNVGGYSTGWNHRQSYIRVYDPRGFEFEITLENLLFIIENTSLIAGKGIEGEFVYGWDGKDLVLIPCKSPDYIKIKEYNELIRSDFKLTAKTIKLGATYRNDKQEDLVYVGRYNKYNNYNSFQEIEMNSGKYEIRSIDKGKKYWFYDIKFDIFVDYPSLNKFKMIVNDEPLNETSNLMERLLKTEDLQYYTNKSIVNHSINNEEKRNELLKLIYHGIETSKDASVYLYDKEGNIKYHLFFDKDYKYKNTNRENGLFYYKVEFIKHEIKLVSNIYYKYKKERQFNKEPLLSLNLDLKEAETDNVYLEFKNYKLSIDEFTNKFNELVFNDKSFVKDLYYHEYVSNTNEDVKIIPINYYLNILHPN